MTRKERALKNLKQMCSDGRYLGSGSYAPLEVLEDFEVAIKALAQEPILDKIRAEILEEHENAYAREDYDTAYGLSIALNIIDKYKSESEKA